MFIVLTELILEELFKMSSNLLIPILLQYATNSSF